MGANDPCYECPDRHVGCHSECDRYKEFACKKREASQKAWKIRMEEHKISNYVVETKSRMKRGRHKK